MIVKAIGWVLPRHLLDIWIQFELRHTIPIAKGVTPHQPFSTAQTYRVDSELMLQGGGIPILIRIYVSISGDILYT